MCVCVVCFLCVFCFCCSVESKKESSRKDFDVLTHLQKLSEKGTPEETCCPFSYHSSSSSGLQLFSSTRTNASSFRSLFSSLLFSSRGSLTRRKNRSKITGKEMMKNFMKRISSTETLNSNAKNNSAHPHNNELLGKTIQVEGKKFRLVEVLSSSGASAVVYKAKFVEASSSTTSSSSALHGAADNNNNNNANQREDFYCAMKVLELPDDSTFVKKAKTEVSVHKSLSKNAHVVTLFGAEIRVADERRVSSRERAYRMCMCMELCDGDLSMRSFSNDSDSKGSDSTISKKELEKILEPFLAVCDVLKTMHGSKLCHWDIKRENVLFSKSENLYKVCDFGSCEFAPASEYTYKDANERHRIQDDMKSKTTPAYRAPEMWDCWKFQKPPSLAADLWALGCFLHELAYDELAFGDASEAMLRSLSGRGAGSRNASALSATPNGKKFSKEHEREFPRQIPGIDALVRDLCKLDPDDRISASEAQNRALRLLTDLNDFPKQREEQNLSVVTTTTTRSEEKTPPAEWVGFEPSSTGGYANEDPFLSMPPPPPRLPKDTNTPPNTTGSNGSLIDDTSTSAVNSIGAGEADAGETKKIPTDDDGSHTIRELKLLAKVERLERRIQEYQTREQTLKTKLQSSRTQLEQERECRQNLEKKLGISSSLSKNSSGSSLNEMNHLQTPAATTNEQGVQTNHHTNNNMHRRGSHSRSGSDLSISGLQAVTAQHGSHRRSGSGLSSKLSALEEMSIDNLSNPYGSKSMNTSRGGIVGGGGGGGKPTLNHRRAVSLGGEFDLLQEAKNQGKGGLFSHVFRIPPSTVKNKSIGMDKPYG